MRILFLCTGNSCRSQMAEGWARALGGDGLEFQSAGIEAHGKNLRALQVMQEAGVDISGQESTRLTDAMLARVELVVTVCGHADEHCPVLPPGTRKERGAHPVGHAPEPQIKARRLDLFRDHRRRGPNRTIRDQLLQHLRRQHTHAGNTRIRHAPTP